MRRIAVLALIAIIAVLWLVWPRTSPLRVVFLRCEHRADPLGIGERRPLLSWRAETTEPERRGQGWNAFRVRVASSLDALARGLGELWDSGVVAEPDRTSIEFGGSPLASGAECWWTVRVWDRDGRASPWSAPRRFTVGLLDPADWSGDWIGLAGADGPDRTAAPWLRRALDLPAAPRRAIAHVASIGYHELHVNGAKIGDAELAPSVSDLSRRVRAVSYDVTDALHVGANAIGLWLGPGWSRYPRYGVPAGPLVRAVVDVELADGRRLRVATGPDWRARPSHVAAIGGCDFGDYGGERVDAGREVAGWATADLDDADWPPARAFTADVAIAPDAVAPNRLVEELRPVAIEERLPGVYRVDMGRSFTGITEARLHAAPGATIRLSFAEREDQDATYAQRSELVVGPDGTGVFRHRFSYAAARWITIEGASAMPAPADVRGFLVRTGYARTTEFACSDPLLQRVHDTVAWTFECLSLGGYVVDCAHRERWGYGGDAHATMETALDHFDLAAFYGKWLDDWAAIQDEVGNLPFTCPTYRGGGGPAWSGIVVMLPFEVYRRTGDRRLLERAWPTIERWLAFLDTQTTDGILQFYFDDRYTKDVYSFLGDWVPPGGVQAGGAPDEERKFFNNAYRVWAVRTAARIAAALGRSEDAARLGARADALAEAVHARFFDAARGVYVTARQTYYALPVLAEIGPAEVRDALFARLCADVEERRHVDTGIHGTWFLVKLLLERGRTDLLQVVASQRDFPSWGDMLERGATTIWEQWDGINSRMHSSFLSIGAFFVEGLAGIRPDDAARGSAHVVVAPRPVAGLTAVRCAILTPHGRVLSAWSTTADRMDLELEVPVGATATLRLAVPAPDLVVDRDDGTRLFGARGVLAARTAAGGVEFDIGSGRYVLSVPR